MNEALYRGSSLFLCEMLFVLLLSAKFSFVVWRQNVNQTSHGIPFTTRATIKSHTLTSALNLYLENIFLSLSHSYAHSHIDTSARCHDYFWLEFIFSILLVLNYIRRISVISAVGDIDIIENECIVYGNDGIDGQVAMTARQSSF